MGSFRLGDIATGARALRPCWPKEAHPSQGKAEAHLRALARRDERDAADLNTYACRWCDGWHVGHRPLQKEDLMPRRLINLFVKSIAAVRKPANKRPFLIVKSEGSRQMRALTYDDFLTDSPAAQRYRALTKTAHVEQTTSAHVEQATSAFREVLGSTALRKRSEQDVSAVSLVEERIAQRIDRNPVTVTRAVAMQEVFSADPALYESYRRETTIGRDGQAMSADPAFHDVGVGRVVVKSDTSVDAEVARRVESLMAKTAGATREQAVAFVFREHPDLAERWMCEYA